MSGSGAVLVAMIALALATSACRPQPEPSADVDQGWDITTTQGWYHIDQGTALFPYEWLLALEQPESDQRFTAPAHLARFGFVANPQHPESNPDGLPVGFARTELDLDLGAYQCWHGDWVGLTCAACHTSEFTHQGTAVRIDGGPAHNDIETFRDQLAAALGAMQAEPAKAQRFAVRVLKAVGDITPEELGASLRCIGQARAAREQVVAAALATAEEEATASGSGRLDALGRGGNSLFAEATGLPGNYEPTTAPVSFPHLWDTPYFDWVLYNNSVRQPLARSIVEALGVGAPIDLRTLGSPELFHRVKLNNLVTIQQWLQELQSPRWPDAILGRIDRDLAERGAELYPIACGNCHQIIDRTAPRPVGTQFSIPSIPIEQVGTDPRQAVNFATREITLGATTQPLRTWVEQVTGQIVRQYVATPEGAARAASINGSRANDFQAIQAYRARPLNGVWATAPYLHNGSVPDMVELLEPADERPSMFYVGNWEFDPTRLGFAWQNPGPGWFEFDTSLPGNANTGHDYGTDLEDDDKAALIEYLKTL